MMQKLTYKAQLSQNRLLYMFLQKAWGIHNAYKQDWLSDMQVIFRQTDREVWSFPSAGMVGKQGVAAPVSCRFWDICALYVSLCIIV
jgi:hypothetical protein